MKHAKKGAAHREIFVFGSNLAGKHYGGAAAAAVKEHGAKIGVGVGMTGESYALPTLDEDFEQLPLERIGEYVREFIEFAAASPDLIFNVTRVGCGIAGFTDDEISPLFTKHTITPNVILPKAWGGTGF